MLTKQQATAIVRALLSANQDVAPDRVVETGFAWLFFPNNKEYIRTGNRDLMEFGTSKCLVQKADGKVHWFSSYWPDEDCSRICELGYLEHEQWDIEVTGVLDEVAAVKHLSRLELESLAREGSHGVYVTTRTRLSAEQLSQKLKSVPVRLFLGQAFIKWKVLESFKSQAAFTYRLGKHEWDANASNA